MSRFLALALFVAGPAEAWEHIGYVWAEDDFPLPYQTDILEQGGCDDIAAEDCLGIIDRSWAAWEQECLPIGAAYEGELPSETGFNFQDDINSVTLGDTGPGVLGFSFSTGQQFAFILDGQTYFYMDQTDIVISNDVAWDTVEDVAAGDCTTQSVLESTLVHEVGHSLGLGHSCDDGEPCTDSELLNAVMFWRSDACDAVVTPQADDLDGISALYGGAFSFACGDTGTAEISGIAPLTLTCSITSDIPMERVAWRFGDGEFGEGEQVEHTWAEEGLYDVFVEATAAGDQCAGLSTDRKKQGYVRVCGLPRVKFELDHVLGKTWEIKNETDIDVLGCITDAKWALYQGDSIDGEPHSTYDMWEFTLDFPEEGTWTLVLNVGGPAGTAAAQATVEVVRESGLSPFGCQHSGGPLTPALVWIGLAGLLARRRFETA